MIWKHLTEQLWAYGLEVRDRYRRALSARGIDASGRLSRTAAPVVKSKENVFTLYLRLQDYWKWVEYGTRTAVGHQQGKRPPVAPFVAWVKAKGIPYGPKGPLPVAYAVAWKVWKTGTLPKNVLGQATYDTETAEKRLERAALDDIELWLAQLIDNIKIG